MSELERRKIDFSVFLLYRLAERLQQPAAQVYRKLEQAKVSRNMSFPTTTSFIPWASNTSWKT